METAEGYDSTPATVLHIMAVQDELSEVTVDLVRRMRLHDKSKLEEPEKSYFDKYTPRLAGLTYGTPEYHANLEEMRPAIDHHNAANRHHPEHFENGINGMNLIDLIEMLCDWKAATARHADGDIRRSLEINRGRFEISDQLGEILSNTIRDMGW